MSEMDFTVALDAFSHAGEMALMAEETYRIAHASAYLGAEGTENAKKARADIATTKQREERDRTAHRKEVALHMVIYHREGGRTPRQAAENTATPVRMSIPGGVHSPSLPSWLRERVVRLDNGEAPFMCHMQVILSGDHPRLGPVTVFGDRYRCLAPHADEAVGMSPSALARARETLVENTIAAARWRALGTLRELETAAGAAADAPAQEPGEQ